jgi:hypothetical protein
MPDTRADEPTPAIVQFLAAEHFTLQSARASTVNDINGRATIFLNSVSAGVVALAFLGQASHLGPPFYVFALVLFPSLALLGFATLARTLQSSIEDTIYARGMNRIRHYFVERTPDVVPYVILSTHDDTAGVMWNIGIERSSWQMWLTTAGIIAMITAILIGVFASLAVSAAGLGGVVTRIGAGVLAFLGAFATLNRYQRQRWRAADRRIDVHFPTPTP